jgi:hypothetical protein
MMYRSISYFSANIYNINYVKLCCKFRETAGAIERRNLQAETAMSLSKMRQMAKLPTVCTAETAETVRAEIIKKSWRENVEQK